MSWREYLTAGQLFMGNKGIQVKQPEVLITVGAEATNVINVALDVNDALEGAEPKEAVALDFYLADDAAGLTPSTVAPTGGIAIGTDGALIETVADLSGKMISELNGSIDIDITDAGTPTFYLVVLLPCGGLVISDAITFA